uniref:Putative secreted peptide n=1 Tax=Rhipicephalus pulchellus TaxID=72859 RepID=L7M9T8_RHIPC
MGRTIAAIAVCLLSAAMTQGKYDFDKDVESYVDAALTNLKQIISRQTATKKPVMVENFVSRANKDGNAVVVRKYLLGHVKGLDTLERMGECHVNQYTNHYKVWCPVIFIDLHCILPRLHDTIYVLKVATNGTVHFRLLKHDRDVRGMVFILPNFTYSVDQKDANTMRDLVGVLSTVPPIYRPTEQNIQGRYTEILRHYLTEGGFFTYLQRAFSRAFHFIKDKIK